MMDADIVIPLGEKKEIISHFFDIQFKDNFKNREYSEIHMWCITPYQSSILIRLQKFPISFYVLLPEDIDWSENSDILNKATANIKKILGDHKFNNWELEYKETLHFLGKKKYMIKLDFDCFEHAKHCKNLISKGMYFNNLGKRQISVLEYDVSTIRKYITERNAKYSQWMKIDCQEVSYEHEERISIFGPEDNPIKEYIGDYNTLFTLNDEESKHLVSNPSFLCFDIETYSPNHRAMPKPLSSPCCCYLISCRYGRNGLPEYTKEYAILFGDSFDIPGKETIRVDNEIDATNAFTDLIVKLDPDIIMGYNIDSYDCGYLDDRLKYMMKNWQPCGRIQGEKTIMKSSTMFSKAYGHSKTNKLQMSGRITIDLLPYLKKNNKFDKYSLDFVSNEILHKTKHNITAMQMFKIYELFTKAETKYKKELEKIYKKSEKSEVEIQIEQSIKELKLEDDEDHILKDTEKKFYEMKKIKCSHLIKQKFIDDLDFAKKEMTRVVEYCIQDSALVVELFEKLNIWISLVTFTGVVGVTITEFLDRGQQIRCKSQIYDECYKRNIVIDKGLGTKLHYTGAYVATPIVGLHDNIIGLDFNSLYPSIIIAYNICYSTMIDKKDWEAFEKKYGSENIHKIKFDQKEPIIIKKFKEVKPEDGETDGEDSDDEEDEKKKSNKNTETHIVDYEFWFVKKNIKLGVLPKLLEDLISERKKTRDVKKIVDADIRNIKSLLSFKKLEKEINNSDNILYFLNSFKDKERPEYKDWLEFIGEEEDINILKEKINSYQQKLKISQEFLYLKNLNYEELQIKIKDIISRLELKSNCLEQEQLAKKVSANSMYGYLGAQNNGLMPLIEGALCVTAMGRILIKEVNKYVIEKYNARIIYGDTDSSMIDFGITDSKQCTAWGKKMEREINGVDAYTDENGVYHEEVKGLFLKPLKIEYEKGMRIFCVCPKKYSYFLVEDNGDFERNDRGEIILNKKGMLLARRDNTPKIREIYYNLLMMIMNRKNVDDAFKYLIEMTDELISAKVNLKELCVTRGIGGNYASQGYYLNVFSQELARMGNPVEAGDRVESIVVKTLDEIKGKEVPIGLKMRLPEMYYESRKYAEEKKQNEDLKEDKYVYPVEEIDYMYYLEKSFMKPIDQIFEIGFPGFERYNCIGYEKQYLGGQERSKFKSINQPMKMIFTLISDYFRFYRDYNISDTDIFKKCSESIKLLPEWFIDSKKEVDYRMSKME